MKWILLSLAMVCGCAEAVAPWWQPLGPIEKGVFGGGHADEKLSKAEAMAAKATTFAEWVTYEDDLVKFRYPKNPEIKLEVIKKGQPVKVEGGVCTSVDNAFQQAYVIKVGAASYGIFLLNPTDWLDDGICMCGPMIHHVYTVKDKCLVRYSLLPGNAVKKAQWLGGGMRLMAFEWTHVACPREIYEEMINSMVLKIPSTRSEAELKAETIRRYGLEGRAGWLHPGMSEKELSALFEAKPIREANELTWTERVGDYLGRVSAELDDEGNLVTTSGAEQEGDGPIEGTLTWVNYRMKDQDNGNPIKEESIVKALPPGKMAETLLALSSECSGKRRREWLQAVLDLVQDRGFQDQALLQEVLRDSNGRSCELEVLKAYHYPEINAWVARNLTAVPTRQPAAETRDPKEDADLLACDARDLLVYAFEELPSEANKTATALIEASKPYWANALVEAGRYLSPKQARQAAVQALGFAMAQKDEELVKSVLEMIKVAKFDDPAPIKRAVEKFPRGKPGSEWDKDRKAALDKLSGKP